MTANVDGWLNLPPRRFHEKRPAEHFYRHAIRFDDMFEQLILPLKGQRPIQVEADLAEETATVYHRHMYDFRESTLSCSKASTWKHFCSWLGLALHNDISGGRVLRPHTPKVISRAPQAFRQAAQSVPWSSSSLGAYFRAMGARLGLQQATVATAHKIARMVYHLLKDRKEFPRKSAQEYEQARRERELKHLSRRAKTLGYTLIPATPSQPAPAP